MRTLFLSLLLLICALAFWWIQSIPEPDLPSRASLAMDSAISSGSQRQAGEQTAARTDRSHIEAELTNGDPADSALEDDRSDLSEDLSFAPGALRLRVVDHNGQALANEALRIIRTNHDRRYHFVVWRGYSRKDGSASIEQGMWWRPTATYVITLSRPLYDAPVLEIPDGAWPDTDLVLTLPEPARWKLQVVDDQDRPFLGERLVHLTRIAQGFDRLTPWMIPAHTQQCASADDASFAVPSACVFEAYAEDQSGEHFPGARVRLPALLAGEARVLKLALGSTKPWVKLRLLDEDGASFASAEVLVWCGDLANTWNTDSEGQLRVRLDRQFVPGSTRTLRILGFADRSYFPRRGREWNQEHQDLKVELDLSYELGSGEHDLGTHTMRRAPPILEGLVLGEHGEPVPFAAVEVYYVEASETQSDSSEPELQWLSAVDCDEKGKFALRSASEAKKFQVQASRKDLIAAAPIVCQRFDRDLRIYLVRPAKLSGRVILPKGMNPFAVYFHLQLPAPTPEGGTAPAPTTAWKTEPYENYFTLEADGSFALSHTPPGTARLRLLASEDERVLAEMNIELRAGEVCEDARLASIAVR